ncbi:MAG: DUF938 domain-containing protein [Rhodospirillaceae bacterium]|nr:DUF938 domain-containing protein [Rhodospirillaceae bacterium]
MSDTDDRLYAPATQRNRAVILDVLRQCLPESGTVLEIASGSGEHAVFFARHLPGLCFQPSDADPACRASIAAWMRAEALPNVLSPLALDAAAPDWPIAAADAVICCNMIHIAPWAAASGLIKGAARILPAGAPLYLYGPYLRAGIETAPSNLAFDRSLRAQNPAWGLRDLDAVAALAAASGFAAPDITPMPANNLSLVFRRR